MFLFDVLRQASLECAFIFGFSSANCICKQEVCLHTDVGRQQCKMTLLTANKI